MGKEIERKFLVSGTSWQTTPGTEYRQGYLSTVTERTVRVRTIGEQGYLTIKGKSHGATRLEFEYPIPVNEANQLLNDLCHKPIIEKVRRKIEYGGLIWEVDEFFGDNLGLILAEVELTDEDQAFEKPDWVTEEVTADPRYFNSSLVDYPYNQWKK